MLELKHITKTYKTEDFAQVALDDVSVTFRDSEFVAVLGPSGSGKTTMLNILGGLDHADAGDIVINGVSTKDFGGKDWDTYRNHHVGFVFQSYNLIPHQTVLSNVELALTLAGVGSSERRRRAQEALDAVGLGEHAGKRPAQLSGGQMQRVAIARALVNDPDIVLADEPTGALDTDTGIQVMDILRDVAKDRLVVMVTHNPELAEEYATRIVSVRDGRIVGDTRPPSAAEVAAASSPEAVRRHAAADAAKGGKRASMGFLTALSLSFNNLMTKKGRTFMTAFAGSIGIIGIAAILALSNGVNNYIKQTEEDSLAGYPLQITKSSFDMSSLMSYGQTGSGDSSSEGSGSDDVIPQEAIMTDMFAQVKTNDLSSFKSFLDGGGSGIGKYVNAIEYDYGVTPQVYLSDTSQGVTRVNPSNMVETLSSGMYGSALTGSSGGMEVFSQLVNDEDLVKSQMELVRGSWPKKADEVVLVLNQDGGLSDYTLYSLGFYDISVMDEMTDEALKGEEVDVPTDTERDFTYDDAFALDFTVVPACDLYQKNESQGTWTDMSSDEDYMASQIERGIKLKVVGVIKPKEGSDFSLVGEGIAYTDDLTEELIQMSADSQIVKEQMANPDVDVFTGKTFEELQESNNEFDMEDMFTIDEDALKQAFTIDTSALESSDLGDIDLSGVQLDQTGFDASSIEVDTSALDGLLSEDTIAKMAAGLEPFSQYAEENGLTLDETQQQAVTQASSTLVSGYLTWRGSLPSGADSSWDAYSQTDEAKAVMAELQSTLGDDVYAQASSVYEGYVDYVGTYFQQQFDALAQQVAQTMATQIADQLNDQMAAATQSMGNQLSSAISSQLDGKMAALSSALQNGFSVDANALQNAIQFNMTQEDLTSLLNNYLNSDQLTYDSNLDKLGYADLGDPDSINIYPKDYDAKESVLRIIDDYNAEREAAGKDEETIQYSDIAGTLMSSVSDIVNVVSTVLIAFVSISLVVSSIMIGIITYISVLERRKEIGILRAMGASKLNVANVFNAETIIEGLIAGVLAIVVVTLVSFPVNSYVLSWQGVPNIMSLPWQDALILIGVSVLLTFLGGLIPSTKASRNDPVESLRSE